jgi:adenosylhomocysteine nucleosidase
MITAPLIIMSALPEEQAGLLEHVQAASKQLIAGREVWLGRMHEREVALVVAGAGKVASAVTTTALIERLQPSGVLFTGVAGGLGEGVAVGDVVVGARTLQHDMDSRPLVARYQIPYTPHTEFAAPADWVARAQAVLQPLAHNPLTCERRFHVHTGLIATGDEFVCSATRAAQLRVELPQALCVEMEGAAVAQVCATYDLPMLAVRTISDRADATAHIDFTRFVTETAGPIALAWVSAWVAST